MPSLQSPSNSISIFNKLAANAISHQQNSTLKTIKKQLKQTQNTTNFTDSTALQQSIDSLEAQIHTVKAQSNVLPKESKQATFTLNDIIPVSLMKAEQAQESQGENQADDNIMESAMPLAEKVKILRLRPDLLRKFVLESQKLQKLEAKKVYEKHICDRKAHRNLICGGGQQIKFIENFVVENRLEQGSEQHRKSKMCQIRLVKGQLVDAQIDDVLSRKRSLLEQEEYKAQIQVSQPRISTILPMIFVNQRAKLGIYLFFSSRIAVLRQVTSVYDKIKQSNNLIIWGKNLILDALRQRFQFNRLQAELRAKTLICRNLRIFVNRRNKNNRISTLQRLKELMLANYGQQTFLGVVSEFSNVEKNLKSGVEMLNLKNNQRVKMLEIYVLGWQKNSAFQIWKKEKENFIAKQMRILQADTRKIKEFKQFSAQYPADQPVLPVLEEDQARIAELELSAEQMTQMCWDFVLRCVKALGEELVSNYLLNSQPGAININVINFIPQDAFLEEMLWVVRRKQNLPDWLEGQELTLKQPAEEFK